jgi:hypothetical protein
LPAGRVSGRLAAAGAEMDLMPTDVFAAKLVRKCPSGPRLPEAANVVPE